LLLLIVGGPGLVATVKARRRTDMLGFSTPTFLGGAGTFHLESITPTNSPMTPPAWSCLVGTRMLGFVNTPQTSSPTRPAWCITTIRERRSTLPTASLQVTLRGFHSWK